MSAIDRAFIRAYEVDEDDAARSAVPSPPARATAPSHSPGAPVSAPHFRTAPAADSRHDRQPHADAATHTERRPLSAFAQRAPAVEARFRPSLEVDAFRWSAVSDALVREHAAQWQLAVDALLAADDAGRSLIGIAGTSQGAGATTVAGCLARLLVEAGKTVAVVDGNFATPGLASSLGLAAQIGWEDVLSARVPLAEAVVQSLDDRIAVLPLVQGGDAAAEKLDAIHASVTAGVLRYHYDIVLFDLGTLTDPQQAATAKRLADRCRLDGLLIAGPHDSRNWPLSRQADPALAALCIGVIENLAIVT